MDIADPRMIIREIDFIRVVGKSLPVTIFEILSEQAANKDGRSLVEIFGRGREAYKARDWRAAKTAFEEVLKRWPNDGPARVFLDRCNEYFAEGPGVDWDGVYEMKHK